MIAYPEVLPHIPPFNGIKNFMYKVRASVRRPLPKTMEDTDGSDILMADEDVGENRMMNSTAEGRNKKVLCETPNEPDPNNTRNEQDANSSDSNNKEDRPADDTKKQKEEAASSPIPSDESSAAGPSNVTPQYEPKERFVKIPSVESSAAGPSNVTPQYELKEKEKFVNIPSVESSAAGPSNVTPQYEQKGKRGSANIPSDESSTAGPSNVTPQYELKEKIRYVNIAFFVKSLKNLNSHGGDGCTLSDMNISGETKNGFNAGIKLSCSVCLTTVIVWMDDPNPKLVSSKPSVPSATSTGTDTEKQLTAEKIPTKKRRFNNRKTTVQPTDSLVQKGCMPQLTHPQVQQTIVPPADSLGQTGCMVQPTDRQVQLTMVPPADCLVQRGCMVQPTDPQVQLTMVPPADSLVQKGYMVQPTDPQVQQTMVPPANHLVHLQSMVPPTLAEPFGPQSNTSPNQGWSHNPLHLIHSQMPPALARPFIRSQINSSHQNRSLNPMHSGHPRFLVPQSNSPQQGWRHNSLHSINQFVMQPQISSSFVPQSDSSPDQHRLYNPLPSSNTQVPPPLARPFLMPQSNTVHQNGTNNLSHSINSHSINQMSFVKQELVSSEDDASSSINQVPRSSTQPSCVQLFFSVEPSENSNAIPESADESTTLTPEETLPSCQTFSTTGLENNQNLANFKNETIVPEKMPTEVLPVDLNLVKEEIEDESQSMEFSVCLVPHSEVSLNHSEAPFGPESNINAKIATDSTLMNIESVMPTTIDAPVRDS